jgi:hypothetical protein
MKCPDFGDISKIGKWFSSGVKGLLPTTKTKLNSLA